MTILQVLDDIIHAIDDAKKPPMCDSSLEVAKTFETIKRNIHIVKVLSEKGYNKHANATQLIDMYGTVEDVPDYNSKK